MRRRILVLGLVAAGAVCVGAGTFVFVETLRPADGTIQSHIVIVDLSAIPPGATEKIDSARGPIFVVHRMKEDLAALDALTSQLRDPESRLSHQPAYTQNRYRSMKPEWFIGFGLTHRGLPVNYTLSLPVGYEGRVQWFGGFYDRYDGALFDKAGRVYPVGHPSEENLSIPEHRYVSDQKVEIYPFGL